MKISENGLKKIMDYEGVRVNAYKDPIGLLTIGVGHLLTKTEIAEGVLMLGNIEVDWTKGLTQIDCMRLLDQDCDPCELVVNTVVKRKLTQAQFDSLVSFCFNCGTSAFRRSTLLKVLNSKGEPSEIRREFMRWTKAGGKTLPGLMKRRQDEAIAFL